MRRQTVRELAETRPTRQTPRELARARAADQLIQVNRDRQARMRQQEEIRNTQGAESDRQNQQDITDNRRRIQELRRLPYNMQTINQIARLEAETAVLFARGVFVVPPTQATEDSIYQRTYAFTIQREPQRQIRNVTDENAITLRERYTGGGGTTDDLTEREATSPQAEREDLFTNVPNYNVLRLRADLANEARN